VQTADVDEARVWFDSLSQVGVEGLVVKVVADPCQAGCAGSLKVIR
jgi:hypothetical protein